jgi:NAD+ kinase
VHPEIPALLITPICPRTLSFRPMLLPDMMQLPYNSRSTVWASFDCRGRVELKRKYTPRINTISPVPHTELALPFYSEGDHIKVTASKYPFMTVCADKQSTDCSMPSRGLSNGTSPSGERALSLSKRAPRGIVARP